MTEQVQQIFVEDIIPNRFQPRLTFDEKALQELSDSIRAHGVIQPLVLRKIGNKYEIIAGERRYKASCMAGLKTVPAIVREMTDNESAEVALIENVQRKNLSSIEEAQSYKNLLDRGYLTQEDLADKLGVSQSTIANKLRLLNLCDEVQNALLNEQISERHARSLLSLTNPDDQKSMLDRIIKERLTVKQLDNEIKKKVDGIKEGPTSNETSMDGGMVMNPVVENEPQVEIPSVPVMESNKNIFGFDVQKPTDLEATAPNLTTGVEETVPPISFNPFSAPVTSTIEPTEPATVTPIESTGNAAEEIETFDMFGDVFTPNPSIQEDANTQEPVKHSIGDQINTLRDAVKVIESNGFIVNVDELDLDTLYQMIIKIQK